MDVAKAAQQAKAAAVKLAAVKSDVKNRALKRVADAMMRRRDEILAANRTDLERSRRDGLAAPLMKRLSFDDVKIDAARQGLESLIRLPDPVGVTLEARELDAGLELFKVSRPIGVMGVIFESRPDALVQISSLCLKSGNAVLLKGGSEAADTNRVLADIISEATVKSGLPPGWITLLETRADVGELLALDEWIDLIIPRGSNEFVRRIMASTAIPVLGHADGICHVYVDREADVDMAVRIVVDSKCQYVAVCNAAETLLVHKDAAGVCLPLLKDALTAKGVEMRGCERTRRLIEAQPATEADWGSEYLDAILSIKIVDSLSQAIDHVNRYGSGHTDVIVTGDPHRARRFMDEVDSADVFMNCSSRFSDGFRYGLGAEVGISTNKIHARGPVGLEGLMIYQWRLIGNGQLVADYTGPDARGFTHRPLGKGFDPECSGGPGDQ